MAKDDSKLIADQAKEIASLKAKISQKEAKASRAMAEQVDWAKELLAQQNAYNDALDESRKAAERKKKIDEEIADYQQFLVDHGKEYSKEQKKILGARIKELKEEKSIEKSLMSQANTQAKISKLRQKAIPHQKALSDAQSKLNATNDKYGDSIKDSVSFLGDLRSKIEEIPIIGGILSKALGLEELEEEVANKLTDVFSKTLNPEATKQAEAAQEALDNYDAQIGALEGGGEASVELTAGMEGTAEATEGAAGASKGLLASLGPVLIVAAAAYAIFKLFQHALALDQEVTDLARGLGVSKAEAAETHHHLLNIAATTKVVGANAEALTKAYQELVAQSGISAINNRKMLESQVLLTKQYGMAGDEAAAFQMTAAGNNVTTEQLMGTVQGMTEEYNKLTGHALNHKQIAKDLAKVSKTISAAYKGDVKALTKAALQAKSMNMSMEQTATIAGKLLDVEGSIEAEMKANVLTGKSMNMNLARQLALQGDSAGAAAEALKQAGSYDDFLKMNIVQQKAVADAAGMTVDELVAAGQMQKINSALIGKEVKDMSELSEQDRQRLVASGDISAEKANELAIQEQQASVQERLAQTLDGIKATFISIIDGPLGSIMEAFGAIVGNAHIMKGIITAAAIAAIPFAISMASAAISAISAMSAMTLGVGAIAIAGGIAVAAASMASERGKAEKVDDAMIDSDGGLVVKGKKGTYQLNEGDSIVAGTELGKSSDGGGESGGGGASKGQLTAIKDLAKEVKGIDWTSLLELEFKFAMIGVAFEALPIDDIKAFGEISGTALTEAGSNLFEGLNNLTELNGKISWWKLWELEVSFDMIEDVFDEIDMEDLTAFASLANANLKDAGTNLGDGLMALIGWDENVDYGQLWSLEDSFDMIEDIFDELDIDDLKGFAELAGKDLGDIGYELQDMFNVLGQIDWDAALDALDEMEDGFDYLEDALDEMDYELLNLFADANWSGAATATTDMMSMLDALTNQDWSYVTEQMDIFEDAMDYLEDALDEIDFGLIEEFASFDMGSASENADSLINLVKQFSEIGSYASDLAAAAMAMSYLDWALWEIDYDALEEFADRIPSGLSETSQLVIDFAANMAELAQYKDQLEEAVDAADSLEDIIDELEGNDFGDFVEGFGRGLKDIATSIFGGGEDESSAASNPAAETNKLLTTLIQKIDQPVKINISGRVIDELESQQSMRRSYNTRIDGAYGANG